MKGDSTIKENKKFDIPKSGSLGLLALGYRGVQAWRKVRDGDDTADSSPKN
ncbi:hypothetical protein [Owenweeksia hongkongensis]